MNDVIKNCTIENYLGEEHQMAVNVIFSDGSTECPLLTFNDTEVTLTSDEFLGKTREEAVGYVHDKRKSFVNRVKKDYDNTVEIKEARIIQN